jgi:hypothetical protein
MEGDPLGQDGVVVSLDAGNEASSEHHAKALRPRRGLRSPRAGGRRRGLCAAARSCHRPRERRTPHAPAPHPRIAGSDRTGRP